MSHHLDSGSTPWCPHQPVNTTILDPHFSLKIFALDQWFGSHPPQLAKPTSFTLTVDFSE